MSQIQFSSQGGQEEECEEMAFSSVAFPEECNPDDSIVDSYEFLYEQDIQDQLTGIHEVSYE